MAWVAVFVGGAVGAPARYLLDRFVSARTASAFPWGTFCVNVIGSFILGAAAAGMDGTAYALVGTGFCGALTTFSTFSFEAWRLAETGRLQTALAYVGASVLVGVLAAAAGWWMVSGRG